MEYCIEKLKLVPTKPGSYQMKDKDGQIIYVGKAKNLKNRLKNYFLSPVTGKTKLLVNEIVDFDYIVTKTELESLILEITLIKKYNPKYNILLKDDKSYPYIELTSELYPRLKIVRKLNRKKSNNHLYGPYPNVYSARNTVNMLNRIYPLRKCERLKKDVCLYYHINECLGYCKNNIPNEVIDTQKKEIISFLKGDSSNIEKILNEKIKKASDNLNYEKALEYKNTLDDIKITLSKQFIDLNTNYNFDLINYYQRENYTSIEIFFVREGLLFGRHNEIIQTVDLITDIEEFIIKFYENNALKPKQLYVNENINKDLLSSYLDTKVEIPVRGKIKQVYKLAEDNAKEQLNEKLETIRRSDTKRMDALEEFKSLLKLDKLSRIESFDNSHLFGTYYVSGMVVFDEFLPQKKLYRKYKLEVDVKDDLSAMKEVIYRRYYKLMMEEERLPDLIVLDGGKLQIGAVTNILESLNLKIPVVGLVKDKKHNTNTLINSNMEEIPIDKKSDLFLFLVKIQNEVHNFAITYHRSLSSKGNLASLLDNVPNIGPVRKKELLKKYKSLKAMKEATVEELTNLVDLKTANNLYNYLKDIV